MLTETPGWTQLSVLTSPPGLPLRRADFSGGGWGASTNVSPNICNRLLVEYQGCRGTSDVISSVSHFSDGLSVRIGDMHKIT